MVIAQSSELKEETILAAPIVPGVSGNLELGENELHLWSCPTHDFQDLSQLEARLDILEAEERQQLERASTPKHYRQVLVTRLLVRYLLSLYADVTPGDWRFTSNQYGKPRISAPTASCHLAYNISRTSGLVLIGIGNIGSLGIDTEYLRREADIVSITQGYFHSREVELLKTFAGERQRECFFRLWTVKEAYLKAQGLGLFMSLDSICVGEFGASSFGYAINSDHAPAAGNWHIESIDLGANRIAAICCQVPTDAPPLRLLMREVDPFRTCSTLERRRWIGEIYKDI